jgi:hypothetical protein
MRAQLFPVALLLCLLASSITTAEQFTTFPDHKELRSPDGSLVIRSVEHPAKPSDFSGVFRTLVMEEVATGRVRKLYDYVGRVAVAWSGNEFIIVTDYVSRRTSRALIFPAAPNRDGLVLDKEHLASLLPEARYVHLRQNDHVFVEAAHVDGRYLTLRVWGYGQKDANGFRWVCRYDLIAGTAACE